MLNKIFKIHPIWIGFLSIGIAFAGYCLANLLVLSFLLLFIAFALATTGFIRGVKGLITAKVFPLARMIAGMVLCATSMVLIAFAGTIVYMYEVLDI